MEKARSLVIAVVVVLAAGRPPATSSQYSCGMGMGSCSIQYAAMGS
jgi:hypothetical protein